MSIALSFVTFLQCCVARASNNCNSCIKFAPKSVGIKGLLKNHKRTK